MISEATFVYLRCDGTDADGDPCEDTYGVTLYHGHSYPSGQRTRMLADAARERWLVTADGRTYCDYCRNMVNPETEDA